MTDQNKTNEQTDNPEQSNPVRAQELIKKLREGSKNSKDQALLTEAADEIERLSKQGQMKLK